MKKRIVLLGMGGTISSTIKEAGLSPDQSSSDLVSLIPGLSDKYEVETQEVMSIDSSNLQPEDWVDVAQRVYPIISRKDVDGVVIVHGTDTMSYTAAALSFMIQGHGKPIVFTGSQIPMNELGSDGRKNLIDALRVAGYSDIAENVIVFDSKIMRSVRTIKLREYDLNAFESTDPSIIGEVAYGLHMYDQTTRRRSNLQPVLNNKLETNVAMLKIFPGMKPDMLTSVADLGYKGLVLDSYGAGNVPIKENSLLDAIRELTSMNIPVVITSQCVFGTTELLYETGILANRAGAIQGFDMIAEVALIKLMWALGQADNIVSVQGIMQRNYVGEINPLIRPTS